MIPKGNDGSIQRRKDARIVMHLISQQGPQTLDEIAAALEGESGFGRAVLAVGHLLLDGKLSILPSGRIALSSPGREGHGRSGNPGRPRNRPNTR